MILCWSPIFCQTLNTGREKLEKQTQQYFTFFLSLCELFKKKAITTWPQCILCLLYSIVIVLDVANCCCIHSGPFILYIHAVLHVHTVNTLFVLISGSSVSVTHSKTHLQVSLVLVLLDIDKSSPRVTHTHVELRQQVAAVCFQIKSIQTHWSSQHYCIYYYVLYIFMAHTNTAIQSTKLTNKQQYCHCYRTFSNSSLPNELFITY